MKRDALVIGINQYPFLKDTPASPAKHLKTPAGDAEAIARLLETYGDFEVRRLPVINRDGKLRVDPKKLVKIEDLQQAIAELFQPSGRQVPETGLLFFAGHGLRRIQGDDPEGYLGTSNANPRKDIWGISLQWLRQLLQESPVRQQIIWLDCCHSGELFNFTESDLGEYEKGRDRCFIAASRDFQVAYAAVEGDRGVLSGALLQGLDPTARSEKWVTNYNLVDFVRQALKDAPQHPICKNFGGQIILTSKQPITSSICPYKGLAYFDFNEEDPKYFHGRTALTNQLSEKVRHSNFLAVLGASGSGKSSVVRAGLLYQLQQGALPGSDSWRIYEPFTPGEHPLKHLEQVLGVKAEQVEAIVKAAPTERVVLTIDQFEEVFALCQDDAERLKFFKCLLDTVERTQNKVCLVLVMRSDFFGKCTEKEYAGLAKKIEQNLVTILPMTQEELREAITKSAQQVDLEVERELVTQMIADVEGSPGNLPLLQYVLTELWQQRTMNRLLLSDYTRLGGVKKALEKQANKVYASFSPEEQQVAKRIFLALTRLGEEMETTRRRIRKQDLFTAQQSEAIVEQVILRLADAKLVVIDEQELEGERVSLVDITHEALIRHWQILRNWLRENRQVLLRKQDIEEAAQAWREQGKPVDLAYLLQGRRLEEAENYLQNYADSIALSSLAQEFVQVSQAERDRIALIEKERIQRQILRSKATEVRTLLPVEPLEGLVLAIQATGQSLLHFNKVLSPVQYALASAIDEVREQTTFLGHEGKVLSVAFSPDGRAIISGSEDTTLRRWDLEGNPIGQPFRGHEEAVNSVAFSPDGKTIISIDSQTVRCWDLEGHPIRKPFKVSDGDLDRVTFSPDGKTIVSSSKDATMRRWDLEGHLIGQPFKVPNQEGDRTSIAFSPDGKTIASSNEYEATVRLWDFEGNPIGQPSLPYQERGQAWFYSLAFSPDGSNLVGGTYPQGTLPYTPRMRLWFNLDWHIAHQSDRPFEDFRDYEGHETGVHFVAFSRDGGSIISLDGWNIRLWRTMGEDPIINLGRQIVLKGHEGGANEVAFSPNGKQIVSAGYDGTLRLWDLCGINLITIQYRNPGYPWDWIYATAFSPDGKLIAGAHRDSYRGYVRLWDLEGNPVGQPFEGHDGIVTSIAFSPNGRMIVSGSGDKTLRLWDLEGNTIGHPFEGHEGEVTSVAFNPDGQSIVSGSEDKTLRLWDLEGNTIGQPFTGHEDSVEAVAFNPDGKIVVSGSCDQTLRLWDLEGNTIGQPFTGHKDRVSSIAFSPNGEIIVSGSWDNTVRLWNSRDNPTAFLVIRGHEDAVLSVSFSPDGESIATVGADRTLRFWDLSGDPISPPIQTELRTALYRTEVSSVAFSPDGKIIVTSTGAKESGFLHLLRGNWQSWLEAACNRLRNHPVFKYPKTDVAREVCETCQKYVWNQKLITPIKSLYTNQQSQSN